jgi:TatA/E family protein of Tat protein translocase
VPCPSRRPQVGVAAGVMSAATSDPRVADGKVFPCSGTSIGLAHACYSSRMFDIGLQEMLVIGVLALLVFGPSKLPELGRMIGRAMREFRRASDEFRSTVETNLQINEIDSPPPAPEPVAVAEPAATVALPSEAESVVAEGAAAVAIAEEHGEPFLAQRGSRIFHRRECTWARRIPEPERIYMKRITEARDAGLATCPVCEPWEPA